MADFHVTIVGAGPTGLVLANLLGKAGLRVLLVERNPATVSEPRAVSIDDESLRVVQEMGLLDEVCSEIVPGYGSVYLGPDQRQFLKVKPMARPYGHPRRNAFRQPVFEAQLREGLRRYPSVHTRFGCTADGFSEDDQAVTVSLRGEGGSIEDVSTGYLVGCDGSWSTIREALGFTLAGSSLDERWLIIDLEDSPSASPETIVFCDPRRPGIMLPGPRDTRRYEFKLMPGDTEELILHDGTVAGLIGSHLGAPGARVVRKAIYHFHARVADKWGRGRVWIAGDAAHLMPPFAGQGMNGGIRDAANLAWKLIAVVNGQLGPALLDTYEPERRAHVREMIKLALRMGAVFGPKSSLHGFAIRTVFRFLAVWPAARTFFAEMKYKPAPRFDSGFLVDRQLSWLGTVGRMLPQPVLPPLFAVATLDDLLGDGFALLGIDVDDVALAGLSLGPGWDAIVRNRVSLRSSDVPEFAEDSGMVFLVRPDRYVMARFASANARAIVADLDDLLRSTWEGTSPLSRIQAVDPAPARPL